MLLEGKSALITGASRGIGKAIAKKFASEGVASLVICARNLNQLQDLKTDLESKFPVKVFPIKCDVSVVEDINNLFSEIQTLGISLDVLVNNAGIMKDAALLMAGSDVYDANFNVNIRGTILVTQKAIKHFIRKKAGSIINFSSIVGMEGASGQSIYAASKAAVIGFTKSMSKELAPFNVRVNAIAPGFIDTDLTSHFNEMQRASLVQNIGFKRFGTIHDVSNVVVFLASSLSDYVTGQVIGVDGGMIL